MLHIVRKKGESISIDGSIKVRILSIDKNSVRIGVEAPRHVAVYRQELYDKIISENALALESADILKDT